jgi:hypothetical protein
MDWSYIAGVGRTRRGVPRTTAALLVRRVIVEGMLGAIALPCALALYALRASVLLRRSLHRALRYVRPVGTSTHASRVWRRHVALGIRHDPVRELRVP